MARNGQNWPKLFKIVKICRNLVFFPFFDGFFAFFGIRPAKARGLFGYRVLGPHSPRKSRSEQKLSSCHHFSETCKHARELTALYYRYLSLTVVYRGGPRSREGPLFFGQNWGFLRNSSSLPKFQFLTKNHHF